MAEFALGPFLTSPRLEVRAKNGLRVHAEGDLLCLHGGQQRRLLFLPLLFFSLGLLSQLFLLLLVERRFGFSGEGLLLLDRCDLFLDSRRPIFLRCARGGEVMNVKYQPKVQKTRGIHSSSRMSVNSSSMMSISFSGIRCEG